MPFSTPNLPPVVQNALEKDFVSHLDIMFAQMHTSDEKPGAFAFLTLSSALWRQGCPHLRITAHSLSPTPPEVSEQEFYSYFSACSESLIKKLFVIEQDKLYLKSVYEQKKKLFERVAYLTQVTPRLPIQVDENPLLSKDQQNVLQQVFSSCFSLICGGPGTGKTFIATQILLSLLKQHPTARIAVVAPTGKAASHIKQSLEKYAFPEDNLTIQTIHKFLRKTDIRSPDLLLVDEGSMVSQGLFLSLIHTLSGERTANGHVLADRFIVLGDVHQLPPIGIGIGSPLQDFVSAFPQQTHHLTTVHRTKNPYAKELAQAILHKKPVPFTPLPSLTKTIAQLTKAYQSVLPTQKRLCVLTPMRQGLWGGEHLNTCLFRSLQALSPKLPIPIISIKNFDTLELANGETGFLLPATQQLHFDSGQVVSSTQFPYYTHNYVTSIHKSQGSEYDQVIVLVPPGSHVFDPAILYTAVTRTKDLVTIWADEKTLNKLIHKTRLF